jgi:hypothetical protein
MRLIDTILGKQNVQQLPTDQQDQARSEAYRQFILGSLFGGRGLASGYAATQQVIPGIQAAQQQRRIGQVIDQSMVPQGTGLTQFGQGSQGGMLLGELQGFENDPAAAALIDEAAMRNPNIPKVFDASSFAKNIAPVLAGKDQKAALEIAQMAGPVTGEGGIQTNRFTGQITGSLPTVSGSIQRQLNVGTNQFEAQPVVGALSAQARTTLPTLAQGEEFVYDRNGEPTGIRNVAGAIKSLQERVSAQTTAEEAAKSEFDLVDITMPDGSKQKVTRAEYIRRTGGEPGKAQGAPGLTTELSPAQQAVQGEFQKTLDSARGGFETARRRAGTIQQLRNAINSPDFETGFFTNQKAALTNMLASLGVTGDRANAFLRNATSFRQGVNDLTMSSLAELVGAISNFEINFSQNRFGTITDPTEANQFALDLLEAKDRIASDYYNFLLKNPSADAVEKWRQSEQGSRNLFEDPKLRKWLEKRVVQSGPNKGKTAYLLPDSAEGSWVVFD